MSSTVAKKADEMQKVEMRKRKQEAEVEKLFKKVVMEETLHSFLLDHLCSKRTSKAAVLLQKPTEEKGVEEHNDPSLDHDLGPGIPFMSSSCCVLCCCSLELGALCLGDLLLCLHGRRRKNRETETKRIEEEAFHDPPPLFSTGMTN